MAYFDRFPLMAYDVAGNKNYKLLPDILRRVKLRSGLRSGSFLFDRTRFIPVRAHCGPACTSIDEINIPNGLLVILGSNK